MPPAFKHVDSRIRDALSGARRKDSRRSRGTDFPKPFVFCAEVWVAVRFAVIFAEEFTGNPRRN